MGGHIVRDMKASVLAANVANGVGIPSMASNEKGLFWRLICFGV